MKKINKILSLFAVSALIFTTSCSEDDDNTGASMINYTDTTVTLSSVGNTEFSENALDPDDLPFITVMASIPEAVLVDIYIPIVQVGGTANSSDFTSGTIAIPSGFTSGSTKVIIEKTGDVEGDETLVIGAGPNIPNVILNPFTVDISINDDYINDILNVEFDWEGEFEYEDDFTTATYNFCAMDFDFIIYDSNFADTGNIDAQTGSCPEHVDFDPSWPDGEYIITAYLYDNPYIPLDQDAAVPITVNYDQEFFDTSGSMVVPGFTTNSVAGTQIPLVTVTKSGYNFTVAPY